MLIGQGPRFASLVKQREVRRLIHQPNLDHVVGGFEPNAVGLINLLVLGGRGMLPIDVRVLCLVLIVQSPLSTAVHARSMGGEGQDRRHSVRPGIHLTPEAADDHPKDSQGAEARHSQSDPSRGQDAAWFAGRMSDQPATLFTSDDACGVVGLEMHPRRSVAQLLLDDRHGHTLHHQLVGVGVTEPVPMHPLGDPDTNTTESRPPIPQWRRSTPSLGTGLGDVEPPSSGTSPATSGLPVARSPFTADGQRTKKYWPITVGRGSGTVTIEVWQLESDG